MIKLWNLAIGQLIRTLETSGQPSFSADGKRLLVHQSSYQTSQTEVWNWRSPTLLDVLPGGDVVLNADGAIALSPAGQTVEVWRCCQ
ncbi:MAG: hypothetical protein AAFQ89_00450 [Cyanobacteria bacterium J06626_18]